MTPYRSYGEQESTWSGPTIAARYARLPPDCPAPDLDVIDGKEASRKALRAFWRGVVFGGLLTGGAFIAGAAFAEPSHDWGGSSATLSHGTGDAVAEVECVNRITSGPSLLSFTLTLDGFEVAVTVEQGDGDIPDTYIITPPPGYFAVPPSVSVAEHDSATIQIFLNNGGMS